MIIRQYYSELGKYLYAVAFADGNIQQKESRLLEKEVFEIIRNIHQSDKNINKEIIFTKLSFFNCIRIHQKPREMVSSFTGFMMKHGAEISNPHRKTAIKLIASLSQAYKGISEKENELYSNAADLLAINKPKK